MRYIVKVRVRVETPDKPSRLSGWKRVGIYEGIDLARQWLDWVCQKWKVEWSHIGPYDPLPPLRRGLV